ncbi:MAG: sodium-dependent transporter, partial [Anaerotignaceae bacterium]
MEREKLSSRLGFILISAGCAIGLGNVWRFPYITGVYGGGAFVLLYILFLVILGIPIMTMEFSVGRASQRSVASSFGVLEPKGTKWNHFKYIGIIGNYLLMMFYTTVAGWLLSYFVAMVSGDFVGLNPSQVGELFGGMLANPTKMTIYMIIVVILCFGVCSIGLQAGVERVTKVMMLGLLAFMVVLAIRSITLPGGAEGLEFYLKPDFGRLAKNGLAEAVFAAMGQAFFTLSIGIGCMAIFGSYLSRERTLMGEAIYVTVLDTFVALMAGVIILPACFAYGVDQAAGPALIFITLPNIFNEMPLGQMWGIIFFTFMTFAAFSTVIAVFENIISFASDLFNIPRRKAAYINIVLVIMLSMPCVL